jgi:protein TonB
MSPISSPVARFYQASEARDPDCLLAWVNSVCILVLIIGIVGANEGIPKPKPLPSIEQPIPAIVEPMQPPPQTTTAHEEPKDTQENQPEAPQVVAVTAESPAINFSVPTIGNILVPNSIAVAPPLKPLAPIAPLKRAPANLTSTGTGGTRPDPPYPKIALQEHEQGSVILQMTVDDSGHIIDVQVKQSSGFPLLDRSALDFVRKHWTVVPGEGARLFEATITYKLQ